MKQLPLTSKQIEICDFILKNNNIEETYFKLEKLGHSDFDNRIASKFLLDNNLITLIHPVILTDIGSRYANKGIIKFIKHKRRDDFLRSPIFMTFAIWIPIIISLAFGITNYRQNKENKRDNVYIKRSEIDSIFNEKCFKKSDNVTDKFTNKESFKDTSNHIDKNNNVKTE